MQQASHVYRKNENQNIVAIPTGSNKEVFQLAPIPNAPDFINLKFSATLNVCIFLSFLHQIIQYILFNL